MGDNLLDQILAIVFNGLAYVKSIKLYLIIN